MNGPPLKFKLYNQGDFVGYEKHEYNGIMEIWHSNDGEEYHCILDNEQWYIVHDRKRQYAGFTDRENYEIYFGDRFLDETTGEPYPGKVEVCNGRIGFRLEKKHGGYFVLAENFKYFLLAEDS